MGAADETMVTPSWSVRRLSVLADAETDGLADLLVDCVDGGASVGFLHPLTRERALAFWHRLAPSVAAGQRAVLVARSETGIIGTVQLVLEQPENQTHRADLVKLLVDRRVRRQGLAAALMAGAEATARQCGKTLLVLDAVSDGDAARLYEKLGWQRVGEIPEYFVLPRGGLSGTTLYFRTLGE